MVNALQPQSHGRGNRRFPLVYPGRRQPHLRTRLRAQSCYHYILSLSGPIPFPQNGKNLRRFDIEILRLIVAKDNYPYIARGGVHTVIGYYVFIDFVYNSIYDARKTNILSIMGG